MNANKFKKNNKMSLIKLENPGKGDCSPLQHRCQLWEKRKKARTTSGNFQKENGL